MARFRMTALAFALVLVSAFAVAEAWRPVAPSGGGILDVRLASSLEAFDDCNQFLDTVRGEALKQVSPYGLNGGGDGMFRGARRMAGEEAVMEADMSAGAAVEDSAASGGAAGMAFAPEPATAADEAVVEVSGTNNQESDVDEADVVKTDGRVLAAVARGRLQLVDLRDGGRRLAASIPLSQGWGHELLLHDGRLLVTATVEEPMPDGDRPVAEDMAFPDEATTSDAPRGGAPDSRIAPDIAIMPMGTPKLELMLIDVRDPADPKTLGSVRMDGQLVSSRLVDGMVRVVMRSNPQPDMAMPQHGPGTDQAEMRDLEDRAVERNREILESSTAEDWLPAYAVRDAQGDTVQEAPLVQCDAIRHPVQFRGFGLLSVLAVPMTGEGAGALTPTGTAGVLGDGDTVYATPDRLYVAMNRFEETPVAMPGAPRPEPGAPEPAPMPVEPDGGIGDGAVPPDTATSDDGVAAQSAPAPDAPMPIEGEGGIGGEVAPDVMPAPPKTTVDIHEFDTSDPARPVYTASGSVPGHLLNQWSLSAHEGHLRVATTDGQFGFDGQTSESAVYVLRRDGAKLVEVGRVAGLGKGERIYAVRYFGDYGFVVTFRQTDPLYTLDLSDPAAPRVVGELKVPGFSSYLHPVGDGLLLGVGQDADESTGRQLGVQVSLFDVSDLAAPTRVANLTTEPDSSTEVQHEHRAFLWWPQARRAVLPYQHSRWSESEQRDAGFFGALALEIDGDVREAGRLTHFTGDSPDPWWTQIRRAVVVGDTLYTMSERGLLASGVEDLAERGFTEFDGPTPQEQQIMMERGSVGGEGGVAESQPNKAEVERSSVIVD